MAEKTNGVARLIHEGEEESQAQEDIWKCIFGFTEMAVVKCAIELGISDFVEAHHEPVTLNQLSSALGCSASFLYRILRFLINRGIFKEVSTGHGEIMGYAQTPVSRLLTRDGEYSMAALVLLETSPVMLAPWHYLSSRVLAKENTATFSAAHGKDVWEYAKTHPEHNKLINDALACHARVTMRAIIDDCAEIFKGVESLVDVGGGNGTTLAMLVKAFPWIKGINFDLPHVVSVAPHCHCVVHVEGDMFHSVPNAHAVFLMEYAKTNPEQSKLFNDAMACHARVTMRAIVDDCAEIFKGIESLVDVGGGNGTALAMLVKAFQGINFDLPHVVSVAPQSSSSWCCTCWRRYVSFCSRCSCCFPHGGLT